MLNGRALATRIGLRLGKPVASSEEATAPLAPLVPAPDRTLVGWMGVTLSVPEGWSPVSVSGEGEQGYLKVVSPDTRHLEVKWEKPKGVVSVPDALNRYLEKLKKTARKTRTELVVKERPRGMHHVRPASQAPVTYSWKADRKAIGCIWHCSECGRLVIAEMVGALDDDLSLAPELLRNLQDHGEGDWNIWALYGLVVPVPSAYRLEKQSLMTGHQRFLLRSGGATVQADRWGLAEIALRGAGVREWYESRERGPLAKYAYRVEETEVHGHPAYRFTGRDRIPMAVMKLLKAPATMIWPRFGFHGLLWHCPHSNRIHAVVGEQPRRSDLVERIVARACCHGATETG